MPQKLSDDEAITLALLHGCEFWTDPNSPTLFYATREESNAPYTDFERWCGKDRRYPYIGSETQAELAHRYCEFYKLGNST